MKIIDVVLALKGAFPDKIGCHRKAVAKLQKCGLVSSPARNLNPTEIAAIAVALCGGNPNKMSFDNLANAAEMICGDVNCADFWFVNGGSSASFGITVVNKVVFEVLRESYAAKHGKPAMIVSDDMTAEQMADVLEGKA